MRLIDADQLRTFGSINKGNFNSVETIKKWVDSAETVKAIPIEWIEQYLEIQYPIESPYGTKSYFHDFMTRMIKEWRKENE